MLPQFGYIVAQAGADSRPPSITNVKPSLSTSSQLTKPYLPSSFTRHNSPPMLPPPLPYMYQPRDDYYKAPSVDYTMWQNQREETRWQPESNENKLSNRVRESNDLITRMDTEFWEQCDEIYRDKLESLQKEMIMIQLGTHFAFRQSLADLEIIREQTIDYAALYQDYELSLIEKEYQQEMKILKEDYEHEKYNLHDSVLQSIEEKKKQVKEDKEDETFIKNVFKEAYAKLNLKRNLRKRTLHDRNNSASPSRQDRRKRDKQTIPHNLYAAPTALEEEVLESDFILMKGGNPAKRQRR